MKCRCPQLFSLAKLSKSYLKFLLCILFGIILFKSTGSITPEAQARLTRLASHWWLHVVMCHAVTMTGGPFVTQLRLDPLIDLI